jgi:hypothetical protein
MDSKHSVKIMTSSVLDSRQEDDDVDIDHSRRQNERFFDRFVFGSGGK